MGSRNRRHSSHQAKRATEEERGERGLVLLRRLWAQLPQGDDEDGVVTLVAVGAFYVGVVAALTKGAGERSDARALVKQEVAALIEKLAEVTPGPCRGDRKCCERADEYNGFGSDGPTKFTCLEGCSCHD